MPRLALVPVSGRSFGDDQANIVDEANVYGVRLFSWKCSPIRGWIASGSGIGDLGLDGLPGFVLELSELFVR